MNGRTLITLASGIAIIIASFLITTLALDYFSKSENSAKRANEQVTQIVAGFRSEYANKPLDLGNWATDITGLAINKGFIPASMLPQPVNCSSNISSDTCYGLGPWPRTTVKVYSGQQYNAIGLVYSNLDAKACEAFADTMVQPKSGLVIANINNTGFSFPPFGTSSFPTPPEVTQACGKKTDNEVQLLYGMK